MTLSLSTNTERTDTKRIVDNKADKHMRIRSDESGKSNLASIINREYLLGRTRESPIVFARFIRINEL